MAVGSFSLTDNSPRTRTPGKRTKLPDNHTYHTQPCSRTENRNQVISSIYHKTEGIAPRSPFASDFSSLYFRNHDRTTDRGQDEVDGGGMYSGQFHKTTGGRVSSPTPSSSQQYSFTPTFTPSSYSHNLAPTASGSYAAPEGFTPQASASSTVPGAQAQSSSQSQSSHKSTGSQGKSQQGSQSQKQSKSKKKRKGKKNAEDSHVRSEDISGYVGDKSLDDLLKFIEG